MVTRIRQYRDKIEKQMLFLHGENGRKKISERRKMIRLSPAFSLALIGIFALLGEKLPICVGAGLLPFALILLTDYGTSDRTKKKKRRLRFELSDLMDRLSVLLDAGTSVWNGLVIAVGFLEEDSVLGREMRLTVASFTDGEGYFHDPESALEEFAARCGDASVSGFVSLLIQNSRKGAAELSALLKLQAVNQRAERRSIAKQMAEEASTWMILPSVLVLAAVLALAAAPAVIRFF